MMKRDKNPSEGLSLDVRRRLLEASRERFYANLIESIDSLLHESGHTWEWLSEQLLFDGHLVSIRLKIGTADVTLDEIIRVAQVFDLEPYLLFRPRVLREKMTDREESVL
jgi:hypothetical protein